MAGGQHALAERLVVHAQFKRAKGVAGLPAFGGEGHSVCRLRGGHEFGQQGVE
jgi:hypothetical protein